MRESQPESRIVALRCDALLKCVLMLGLIWSSVVRLGATTPRGVQCPTATAQTILVAKRDCCDRVVGYEVRKLREGEKGFKQCRCAEKRQSAVQAEASPRNDALPPAPPTLSMPLPLPVVRTEFSYQERSAFWCAAPALRPPALA